MFTGIVQATGSVAAVEERGGDLRLTIDARSLAARIDAARLAPGESIAVSGACLTVTGFDGRSFAADVSRETLALTTLGGLRRGDAVNLEAALRAGDPLGGHLMSGHVDGLAEVVRLERDGRSLRVQLAAPAALARYIAPKGSVALDGASLTVNTVEGYRFTVNLIPHTIEATTFSLLDVGRQLNIEVDQIARYLERLLAARQ
ncbi:MAG TPA: riboflavin synthase [Steroidobacteraceae bacterium]|nr:riboflavin synthase [Steroidobacteraceae bacterium]